MIDTSMSPETVDRLFRATRRAHLGAIRFDVLGSWLFPHSADAPEWQTLDVYRAAVRRYGLDAVGVLSGTPLWLARCPEGAKDFFRCPPADYAAWARIVEQTAARAPEIRYRVVRRIALCLAIGAAPRRRALAGCARARAHRRRAPVRRRGTGSRASSASRASR
jgi:hypothetical protein